MDFTGKICPYCKTKFKEDDDVVVCSVCEMPHHKECWIENKACTTFGCTGTIVGAEQYSESVCNKTFCSKCGTAMNEGQKFCSSCGTPAGATGEPHFRVAGANTSNQRYEQNTYSTMRPQQTSQCFSSQYNAGSNYSYGQQIDQDLYSFIQSNQSEYISKFQKMQMTNSKASWNWCGFLFSSCWFAYRKMYGIAAAFAGIAFFAGLIPFFGTFIQLVLCVCSGIFGNYFYKQYIDEKLQTAKSMDAFNKSAYISKNGGTSVGAVIAVIGIEFVLGIIIISV